MFKCLTNWLDDRTGYRKVKNAVLYENIPGGAKWRHVWGTTILFAFILEMISGTFLAMAYSPSVSTAWESVYFIDEQMTFGWLVRGIHFYASQALVPLIIIHMFMLIIYRSYLAPRDLRFWLILLMLPVFFGFGLTGYFLPFDQMGFHATKVRANLITSVPYVGDSARALLLGGSDFGHHTLTRFYTLHVIILPAAMVFLMLLYYISGKRNGIYKGESNPEKDTAYFPAQASRDGIACIGVLAAMALVFFAWGVPLEAPADMSGKFEAARPEWYFISVFILLKFVPLLVGFIGIPTAIFAMFGLMPLIGKNRFFHGFNLIFAVAIFIAAVGLSVYSLNKDSKDPAYKIAVDQAHLNAGRVKFLASEGIPPEGANALLRNDALTQGPKLFAQHCASCHAIDGENGLGVALAPEETSAPDLKNFGSREWIKGFLDPKQIDTHKYWGNTKFGTKENDGKPPKGGMIKVVNEMFEIVTDEDPDPDDIALFNKQYPALIALMASNANLKSEKALNAKDKDLIALGKKVLEENELFTCIDCHKFNGVKGSSKAVDLTDWASKQWTIDFIKNPSDKRFYGEINDRMPAYHADGVLTERQIEMIVEWMRGEYIPTPEKYLPHSKHKAETETDAEGKPNKDVKIEAKPQTESKNKTQSETKKED